MEIKDVEEKWVFEEGYPATDLIFHHIDFPSLYRRIDLKNECVSFTDTARISIDDIIDIEKKLNTFEKAKIIRQIVAVINALRPIQMPYIPERIKVYVLYDDPYLGILAYRIDKATFKVNKFFSWGQEIDLRTFYTNIGKEEENNVDKIAEQTKDN